MADLVHHPGKPEDSWPDDRPRRESGAPLELVPLDGPTEASEHNFAPPEPDDLDVLARRSGPWALDESAAHPVSSERSFSMRVAEVMTRGAVCIGPDATIQAAAQKMKDLDVGSLPVC